MTSLQEYLNKLYPTKQDKEQVKEIVVDKDNSLKEIDGKELDLFEYSNLKRIEIDGEYLKSKLTNLDISDCLNLVKIYCPENQLVNLNVSNCLNLTRLNLFSNQLTNLDVSHSLSLIELVCSFNKLTELDFDIEVNSSSVISQDLANRTKKRQLSLETQIKNSQGETKLSKIGEEQIISLEPMEMDKNLSQNQISQDQNQLQTQIIHNLPKNS